MGARRIINYFFPLRKPIARFPGRLAMREEDYAGATLHEIQLIEAGLARTPQDARLLMRRYKIFNSHELIALLDTPPVPAFGRRLKYLLMRIQGATDRNILKQKASRQVYLDARYT